MKTAMAAVVMSLGLAACGGGASQSNEQAAAPPQKTALDPMMQQLERVQRQAETLPQQRKDNLDRAIESDAP